MRLIQRVLLITLTSTVATAALAKTNRRHATGLVEPALADFGVPFLSWEGKDETLPDTYDLRAEGLVTPVRNQGSCGSCWAFAGVAALESAWLKNNDATLNLSEQEIVSCDRSSSGCSGGWQPFNYMIKHGVGAEADFPYAASNRACKQIPVVAKAVKWGNVGVAGSRATVEQVRKAVYDFGALWVSLGSNKYWQRNSSGVITSCSNTSVNHAVTLAGYEKVGDGYRFIIKNSWGTNWGKQGYVSTPLGCNNLGKHVSFVVPEDSRCAPPEFGLPKEMVLRGGGEVPASGLDNAGMEYTWYTLGDKMRGDGPIVVEPGSDRNYVVRTKNACGIWTQAIHIVAPK